MIYVVALIIVLLLICIIVIRNKLLVEKNKVKEKWAQIDVELKKRVDLIPNLVETVKAYVKHEKETLEEIVQLRNKFNSVNSINNEIDVNNEITAALNKLFALGESYPDLKSNTNFLSLQKDLKDIEGKISNARQSYNDAVLNYNNKVKLFPSNLVAFFLGYKQIDYFELNNDYEREVPKVNF